MAHCVALEIPTVPEKTPRSRTAQPVALPIMSRLVLSVYDRDDDSNLGGRIGVHLPLAAGHGDVDETAGVEHALVGSAFWRLLLLLGLDLMH